MHPSVRTAAHMNTQSHARFWRRRWGLHTCRKMQSRTRRVKWASRPLVTPCVMHLVCSTCAMLCIHAALYTHIPTPPGVPRHEFAQSPIPWGNLQHMHTHWCTLPSAHAHQHATGRIVVQDGLPRMQTLDPLDMTPIRFVTSPFVMMFMTISARDTPFWSL